MKRWLYTPNSKLQTYIRVSAIILCISSLFACGKDSSSAIPDVPVDYRVSVQEFNIKNRNGIMIVNGYGVAGLILTNSSGYYQAFDRCSTVNPEKRCPVVPDDTGLQATDTCSGGKFSLYDGAPVKAPAKKNLKQYSVIVTGGSLIQVSN